MKAEWMQVTPELAAKWLATNPLNRRTNRDHVADIVRDMIEGRYLPSPETMSIDINGNMVDGQHRCLAIIETGMTFPFLVVFDVDPSAREIVNIGKVRSAADVLGMHGYTNTRDLAAIARVVLLYDSYPDNIWGYSSRVTKPTITAYVKANADAMREASHLGAALTRDLIAITRASGGALAYLIARDSSNVEALDDFVRGVSTGLQLTSGDPRHALRKAKVMVTGSWRQQSSLAMGIKAWNAWVEDRPVALLRFRREELPMPKVK